MNNLQLASSNEVSVIQQATIQMPKHESAYVMRALPNPVNPLVNDMTELMLKNLLIEMQTMVSARLGLQPSEIEQYASMILVINRDLIKKFKFVTKREVMFALETGLDGRYNMRVGSVFFNPSNFVQWMDCYLEDKKKPMEKMAMLVQAQAEGEVRIPTPKESLIKRFEIFFGAMQLTINGGSFDDLGNVVFGFLSEIAPFTVQWESSQELSDVVKRDLVREYLQNVILEGEEEALRFVNRIRVMVKSKSETL